MDATGMKLIYFVGQFLFHLAVEAGEIACTMVADMESSLR